MRCLVVLIGLLVTSGCMTMAGMPSIHPHSEIMAPIFCLHGGDSNPRAITRITVLRDEKVSNHPIEWPESGNTWLWRGGDQVAWILEYVPDAAAPSVKPFSCITYGKAPPGYKEKAPALPLTPERLYYVAIENADATAEVVLFFISRLDSMGRAIKLEYTSSNHRAHNVQEITPP